MIKHSILPPSSASRRVACPGSRALEALYPDDESPYAREGHAAHEVARDMLIDMVGGKRASVDGVASNGEYITDDMREGGALYADCVMGAIAKWFHQLPKVLKPRLAPTYTPMPDVHIEERVDISTIHPDCWGTPDAWLYDPTLGLHIWDYKYGHGFVEVFENWQLIEYAAGILAQLGVNGIDDQRLFVTFYIVQPRSYHRDGAIRTWVVRASDLRPYFNILRAKEAEALNEAARCTPSPECRYCTARHACDALQRSALAAVDASTSATPHDLNAIATGNELRYLQHAATLLDARITGLSEQALGMIRRGETVAGYHAEPGKGRLWWTKPNEEVIAMGTLMGVDVANPVKPITPLQAISKGLNKALVESMSEAPAGALKLVPDSTIATRKLFGSSE